MNRENLMLHINEYGSGPLVIVLHGGPGAAGEAAPIARGLSGAFHALEPWQQRSGGPPLTVAGHVADLHEVVTTHHAEGKPALAGESWGAMLALAYAATHPGNVRSLVLTGCGTFDTAARERLHATLDGRMDAALRERLERIETDILDPGERLREYYRLTEPLYTYDALPGEPEPAPEFDLRGHTETWDDMLRLQETGVYPAAFGAITVPVLMLHGAYDPHPGRMMRDGLARYIPHLEYREFERCGHSPWRERYAEREFFQTLTEWLQKCG